MKTGLCLTPNTSHVCLKLRTAIGVFIDSLKVINTLSGRNVAFFVDFAHGTINGVILEES